jgi:uncharacterized membrane protein
VGKTRLEAFSDGVFAIIITIMVLELKLPGGSDLSALRPLLPDLMCYLLSFVMVAIYWNNHHHMLHAVHRVNGAILWANMHLLFWLSLVPFTTRWLAATRFATWPTVLYGAVLLLAAGAYTVLSMLLVRHEGRDSALAQALGRDYKGKASLLLYLLALPLAFVDTRLSLALILLVAAVWMCPDQRIERRVHD